jgi:D-inositol-3-phosphate glycosyltransferase
MNLYVRRLADDLASRGIEVDVFTRRTDRSTPDIVRSDAGARFIHLSAGPARGLPKGVLPLHIPAMVAALREFVHRDGGEYDLVHAHYWLSGMVAIRSRAVLDAPVLTMFHTLSKVKSEFAGQIIVGDSELRGDGERCVIAGSDVIVGATAGEELLMERLYGTRPRRFAVVPPGVDLDRFSPRDRAQSRRRLGWNEGPVALFVGRFDPMKGVDSLLHAFAGARVGLPEGTRLVLAGGDGHGGRVTRRLAQALGLGDAVEFAGPVAPDELPYYYSAADICVVPSVYESFGMAAVEAMASGTPVIAFDVGGLHETIRDGVSGLLIPPGDVAAFGDALIAMLTTIDREEMGRRARDTMRPFAWDRGVEDLLALYMEVSEARQCLCQWVAGA